jgi:hypothetical protein
MKLPSFDKWIKDFIVMSMKPAFPNREIIVNIEYHNENEIMILISCVNKENFIWTTAMQLKFIDGEWVNLSGEKKTILEIMRHFIARLDYLDPKLKNDRSELNCLKQIIPKETNRTTSEIPSPPPGPSYKITGQSYF